MNSLDSVKFNFHSDLMIYNASDFNKTNKEIEDVEITFYELKSSKKKLGINSITVKENECVVSISSKLIPASYSEMININTVERYLNEISNSNLIQFNPKSIIENAEVYSCDVTNNMEVSGIPKSYTDALAVYKVNDKYNCKHYNTSASFERNVTTNSLKEEFKIYCKYPELLLKRNASFRNQINIEDYINTVRAEARFLNQELIRKSFKIPDVKLLSILNSDAKINYNILSRITNIPSNQIQIINNFNILMEMKKKFKHSKIKNIIADLQIIEMCNYDIDFIKRYFKMNSTANNSRYISYYKSLILSAKNIESCNSIDAKVKELKQFLLVA